jgi:hypothetical protein
MLKVLFVFLVVGVIALVAMMILWGCYPNTNPNVWVGGFALICIATTVVALVKLAKGQL